LDPHEHSDHAVVEGQNAQRSSEIERPVVTRLAAAVDENAGDQEPGEDKEQIHAKLAIPQNLVARDLRAGSVSHHDAEDREAA
jgi:hypothetical protein